MTKFPVFSRISGNLTAETRSLQPPSTASESWAFWLSPDTLRKDVPNNIHVHIEARPVIIEDNAAALLPAPLHHRRTLQDPTGYMDDLDLPAGLMRIGLAHGTVTGFGSEDKDTPNYIAPDRPMRAGLSYLALGDWHSQKRINDRCWYSGAPETDAFNVDGGKALLVEIEGADAPPRVTPLSTGYYVWATLSKRINSRADIDFLAASLRGIGDNLSRVLMHLVIEGALSLEDRQYFEETIAEGVSAAFCFLRIDDKRLFPCPTDDDLDLIDRSGFVRKAAEDLKRKAEDDTDPERDLATEALQRLYIEHMKLQTGQQ